jgi:hypothetical protein|tara:strand:+ start:2245 stop:3069 length:825 start_codon:yes stop_codon:yes gene_type:complete
MRESVARGGTREDAIDLTVDDDDARDDDAREANDARDGDVIFTRERRARRGRGRRRARAWDDEEDANGDRPRRRARRGGRRDEDGEDGEDDRAMRRAARARRREARAVMDADVDDDDDFDAFVDDVDDAGFPDVVPFLDEMRAAAFHRFFDRDDGVPRDEPRALARETLETHAPAKRARDAFGAARAPTCAVCLEDPTPRQLVRELPCKHCFHKKCIDRWFRASSVCPTCRANVGPPPRVDVVDRGRANALGVYLEVVAALGRRFRVGLPRRRR